MYIRLGVCLPGKNRMQETGLMELEYKFMLDDAAQGESIVQAIRAGTLKSEAKRS